MSTNVLNAFMAGRQVRNDTEDRDQLAQERQQAQGMANTQGKVQNALMGGDRAGAQQMARNSGNADIMGQFQQQVGAMDEAQRNATREGLRTLGGMAMSVLQAPPEQFPQALAQVLQVAQSNGIDVSQIPPGASREQVQQFARMARSFDEEISRSLLAPTELGENDVVADRLGATITNPNAGANRAIDQQNANSRSVTANASAQRASSAAAGAPGAALNRGFTQERQLRQEFTSITADFRDIQNNMGVIDTVAQRADAQGDLALVVAFTKLLDPGSVAREGEVSLTQSTASTVQQASNWLNRLRDGNTVLPVEVRQAFVEASRDLAGQYQRSFDARRQEFAGIARDFNLNPDRVTVGGSAAQSTPPQAANNDISGLLEFMTPEERALFEGQ
jgi:hypothetical protein